MLSKIIQFLNKDLLENKTWRNSLFFSWRWILLVTISVLLFIPLLLLGILLPLVLSTFIAMVGLFVYKLKDRGGKKLLFILILGVSSFIFNIALILNIPMGIYVIFSSLYSLSLLIIFYTLIVHSKAYLLQNITEGDSEYFSNKNKSSYQANIPLKEQKITNGIIEVDDFKPSPIPKNPQSFELKYASPKLNAKITNTQFKSIRLLKDLSSDQIFYLNSLDLSYSRQFEDKEFLEFQTIKLYLDLCQQADIYLAQKNSTLEKLSKKMSYGYMSYDNTFYSLYFVSEVCVEEFYYGRSYHNSNYSFSLLKDQVDSVIVNYLKQYLKIRLSKLPEVPENIKSQIYSNLNTYQTLGLAFKRLELSNEQKFYLEAIPFHNNIFTEIDQCLDETIKLYLKSITYILDMCNEYGRKSVLNTFNLAQKKNKSGSYNQTNYDSPMSKILQALFSTCQNQIKEVYKHSRLEDVAYKKVYLTEKLGKEIRQGFEELISRYEPTTPSKETQIALNIKNKTKWKNELESLLDSNLESIELKTKCDELLELNSKNPSLYLIYLELCKEFSTKSKADSLWYYYKYYAILTFKSSSNFNLPEPKTLPLSVIQTIFKDDEEKLKQFEIICKTINPLNHSDDEKRDSIINLFKIIRKELKLDSSETQKAHETHLEMTTKLNQLLQEEDLEINLGKNSNSTSNLIDFFAGGSNSKLDFTDIETEFLTLFRNNNFQLSDSQVSDFANAKKQFKNNLIQKINQKFYETHEDNLVEQNDQIYFISSYNLNLI